MKVVTLTLQELPGGRAMAIPDTTFVPRATFEQWRDWLIEQLGPSSRFPQPDFKPRWRVDLTTRRITFETVDDARMFILCWTGRH